MTQFSDRNIQVWRQTEADAFFERNRAAITSLAKAPKDPLTETLTPFLRAGDTVLEIGCANGWRLDRLAAAVPGLKLLAGLDLSAIALQDGMQSGAKALVQADATALPVKSGSIDCVIVGFVCYAVGRRSALAVLAETERVVRENGIVAIVDFLPDTPTENPYHHVASESLSVIKTDLASVLVAYGGYQRVALTIVPAIPGNPLRSLPGSERIAVTVLQRHALPSDR